MSYLKSRNIISLKFIQITPTHTCAHQTTEKSNKHKLQTQVILTQIIIWIQWNGNGMCVSIHYNKQVMRIKPWVAMVFTMHELYR